MNPEGKPWDWSAIDASSGSVRSPSPAHSTTAASSTRSEDHTPEPASEAHDEPERKQSRRRIYGPRTCRICLETVEPMFPEVGLSVLGVAANSSKPVYISDDPDLGRLLCPCKCKGSQKYVHEGCLDAWRKADPTATRNYWQCPTCKFTYQMVRLHWAAMLSSKLVQVGFTLVVSLCCIYILGWVADPILDLWFDPMGTISDTVANVVRDVEARNKPAYQSPRPTWDEQFLKGFLSLGIIGFFKTIFIMTPWDWFNLRGTGMLRGRRGGGRARLDNTNLVLVAVGAFTFLMGIWRLVQALSKRLLKRASDRVLDVGNDDEDEE